jgi:hypothetical protein
VAGSDVELTVLRVSPTELLQGKMFASNGEGSQHFDNARFEQVVARFQREGDVASLTKIVELSKRRALTLIRFNGTACYRTEAELLSDINFKLLRSIHKFDPRKGSGFTYISKIIDSSLRTSVAIVRKNAARHVEFDETVTSALHTNGESESKSIA